MDEVKRWDAVYARVSSREQAENGYGIDVQLHKISTYREVFCEPQELNNVKYYVDEGISAKNLNRKNMKRLLKDIREGNVKRIYIYKLDRISRSVKNVYELIELFLYHDTNLIAIMDRIDIETANGRFFVGILALVAQWERETISERTNDGLLEVVAAGKYPYGSLPFGYYRDQDGFLEMNKLAHKAIIKIFDLAVEGYTLYQIDEQLRLYSEFIELDLKEDKIRRILTTECYTGFFYYKGKLYTNVVPQVINREKYEMANLILSKRQKIKQSERYYFGNKIHCTCHSICERKSTKKKNRRYYYYYCDICKKRINQDYLIDQVSFGLFNKINKDKQDKHIERIDKRIRVINSKMKQLYNRYVVNKLSEKLFIATLSQLDEEKSKLVNQKGVLIKCDGFLSWERMTDKERHDYVHAHISSILIDCELSVVIDVDYNND